MYVGKKYTSTQTRQYERFFQCVGCGFESDVIVVGVGQGQGNSAYFLDNEGAAERATANAERAAAKDAELIVKICPCPKCGRRNSRELFTNAALVIVGLFGGFAGVGWFLATQFDHRADFLAWIMTGAGLIGAAIYYWMGVHLPWTTAERRVAFPERAAAKRRKKKKKKAAPAD